MEQKAHINYNNPDAISYITEELGFTILGGIRIDGLDRLRVTLKIEVINRKFKHYLNNAELADLAIRHNIDLYKRLFRLYSRNKKNNICILESKRNFSNKEI